MLLLYTKPPLVGIHCRRTLKGCNLIEESYSP